MAGWISNRLNRSANNTIKLVRIDLESKQGLRLDAAPKRDSLFPNSPSHVGDILGRHVEHGVWQMYLREVQHHQDVVDRVFDARQMIHSHRGPRQHIRTVLRHEEGDTDAVAQILVATQGRDVRRLVTNTLPRTNRTVYKCLLIAVSFIQRILTFSSAAPLSIS